MGLFGLVLILVFTAVGYRALTLVGVARSWSLLISAAIATILADLAGQVLATFWGHINHWGVVAAVAVVIIVSGALVIGFFLGRGLGPGDDLLGGRGW